MKTKTNDYKMKDKMNKGTEEQRTTRKRRRAVRVGFSWGPQRRTLLVRPIRVGFVHHMDMIDDNLGWKRPYLKHVVKVVTGHERMSPHSSQTARATTSGPLYWLEPSPVDPPS